MKIACNGRLRLILAVGLAVAISGSVRAFILAAQNPNASHPALDQGQKLVEAAQNELAHGATDFGGHRANAMSHAKEALEEIQAARAYYAAHPKPEPPQPVSPLAEEPTGAAKFPHLDAARNSLVRAYDVLNKGNTEFGGHRVKAMEHVKQAIGEIDQAKAYALAHQPKK
jgi:hypothetical protein